MTGPNDRKTERRTRLFIRILEDPASDHEDKETARQELLEMARYVDQFIEEESEMDPELELPQPDTTSRQQPAEPEPEPDLSVWPNLPVRGK